jgi:hypothetical protein
VETVNSQYNLARPDSLPIKIAGYQRRKMFTVFLSASGIAPDDTVVAIGVTSDRSYHHWNYFEAWYPHKSRITAVGLDDASFLEQQDAGVKFLRADGRDLPFEDASFDFAHSSAVIEHVGSRDMQVRFLRELWRVAYTVSVIVILKDIGTKLLCIDEVLHLLAGGQREQRRALNLLKFLANDLRISVTVIGTTDAYHVLKTDPQVASRFEAHVNLAPIEAPFEPKHPLRARAVSEGFGNHGSGGTALHPFAWHGLP